MTLTVVKEVPEKTAYKSVKGYLNEFMKMDVKVVRVDYNERDYKNVLSCLASFTKAIRAGAYPIFAAKRGNEIYLVRRDLD